MTQFQKPSFSVNMSGDAQYRSNWEATFRKKEPVSEPEPHIDCSLGECEGSDNPAAWGHTTECSFWDDVRPGPEKYTPVTMKEIPGSVQYNVREFHQIMGQPIYDTPIIPSHERISLRLNLIAEEFLELLVAAGCQTGHLREEVAKALAKDRIHGFDMVEVADGLGDLAYVIEGMSLELGIDSEAVMNEIHRSNLSKLGDDGKPVYNEVGKVIKGPNYTPPEIQKVLDAQR